VRLPRVKFLQAFIICSGLSGLISGCGYHTGYADRGLPGGYDQIAIPVFINQTSEAGVEVYFTNALIRNFERSRLAKILSKDDSQVSLEGFIDKIRYDRTSPSTGIEFMPENAVLSRNYRVVVTAHLVLRRNSDRRVVWQSSFQNESSYAAPQVVAPQVNTVDPLYNHSARHENIAKIADAMMAEAHDRMTENF
jgi:TolB-like protein